MVEKLGCVFKGNGSSWSRYQELNQKEENDLLEDEQQANQREYPTDWTCKKQKWDEQNEDKS